MYEDYFPSNWLNLRKVLHGYNRGQVDVSVCLILNVPVPDGSKINTRRSAQREAKYAILTKVS